METRDKKCIKLIKHWWRRAKNKNMDLLKNMITDSTQIQIVRIDL